MVVSLGWWRTCSCAVSGDIAGGAPKPDSGLSEERYVGNEDLKGRVLVPEKGLVEDVVILDYKSLYPTIMMAHNLCYSTVVLADSPGPEGVITAPSGGKFVSPNISAGIMPAVLKELLDQRTETKRMMKKASEGERRFLDAKQYALKILLNSFYGYSGYARARLYSLALACSHLLWSGEHPEDEDGHR